MRKKLSIDTGYEGIYWTVKRIKGHKCNLVEEVEPVAKFVKSGWFVPFRRILKRYMTVGEENPMTKAHLKSTYKIRVENMRHLEKYYHMMHPFSDGRFYWDTTMLVIYNIQFAAVPAFIIASKDLTNSPTSLSTFLLNILNIFCILEIILSFFCGYYCEIEQKVVLKPSKVALKYIKTYFFFDVLAAFQMNYIAAYTGWFEPKWYYNIQWIFRFARIGTILKYSNDYGVRWNVPTYTFRTAAYMNIWIILILWTMLLIIMLRYLDTRLAFQKTHRNIIIVVLEMIQNIFLIKVPASMSLVHWNEMLIYLMLLFAGFFLQMFVAAQILQIHICRNISKNKNSHVVNQIKAYTRFKQVPQQLNNRINTYVQFKFQKTIYKEKIILENLSNSLKNEILWHVCQNFITRVDIFKEMPPNVMMKLVMMLKQEIYLPNDVVVQTGDIGTEMFFIYVGVLAVYTATGKEICHLTDGDHFGEIALLLNETRVASCVAIDFCELYRLTKKDFNEALESYPAAKLRIIELGQERLKQTAQLTKVESEELSTGSS
ncbi:hypothetical protein WA026_023751 [Henosepilachna vigintioctopunctata]|uniref:Cyclic nucleotide-binding domain-containing protein n=1 Tax=Henosepilachna vigintioctopunctata TaxID=420089 RepID=A0AAW1U522_9CUCU